jgi:hypothetical protein
VTSGRRVALSFLALFALALWPVLTTRLPPLFDYPNHLARMHILAAAGEGGPLDQYYRTNWSGQPNLAMDLIVPVLARVMPLDLAGRLFIGLIFAGLAGGALWLHRAVHRVWSFWPLMGFLFLYSRILLWGFLNYLFGIGLALGGLALWVSLCGGPAWRRVLAVSIVALAVYFSHIAAFGAFALMLAGFEIEPLGALALRRAWRRLAGRAVALAVPFAAPVALFAASWHGAGDGTLGFTRLARKADLLFSVFDNYHRGFDVLCFVLLIGCLALLATRRRLSLARGPAGALALLGVAYLVLPSQLLSGSGADHRLPLALFLLLVAGTAPRLPRRWAIGVAALFGVMFLARMAEIERVWTEADRVYVADRAALDALPAGARLAVGFSEAAVNSVAVPEVHLPTLAIADRDAFVPTLFAYPSQQPVSLRPPFDRLAELAAPEAVWGALVTRDGDHTRTFEALGDFDFVVLIGKPGFEVPETTCLEPRYRSPSLQLLALDHASPGCGGGSWGSSPE